MPSWKLRTTSEMGAELSGTQADESSGSQLNPPTSFPEFPGSVREYS